MFDIIVTNPPYNRRLHLDILEECVKISKEVVNISPTGHLHDLPAVIGLKKSTFQQYEDTLLVHMKNAKSVKREDANQLFGIGSFVDVDITVYDKNKHDLYKKIWMQDENKSLEVFNKVVIDYVVNKHKSIKGHIGCDSGAYKMNLSGIHGHPGNKDEFDIVSTNYNVVTNAEMLSPASFTTEKERVNFFNSLHTDFMRYINYLTRQGVHIHYEFLPWMGDYKSAWDNERYYEFFKISEKEKELIERFNELLKSRA